MRFGLPQMIHLSLPRGNVCGWSSLSSSQMTFECQTRMRSAANFASAHPLLSAIIGKPGGSNERVLVAQMTRIHCFRAKKDALKTLTVEVEKYLTKWKSGIR